MHRSHSQLSGEFIDPSQEAGFRATRFPDCLYQARLAFQCAAVLNVLFLLNDWRWIGSRHFAFAISARVTIIAVSLLCVAALPTISNFRQLQLVCTAWACPVVPACAVLVSPHTDTALFVMMILPAIFYLALPFSFWLAVTFGLNCSAATLAAYLAPGPLPDTSLGLVLGILTLNVVLAIGHRQSNRLHRLEWSATLAERAANRALSEHRDALQKVFQAVPAPLVVLARQGGDVIAANDAASSFFDLGPNRSQRVEDYLSRRELTKIALKIEEEGRASGIESRLRMPDGSARDVLLAATPIMFNGADAVLTILVDISRRKQMEALLRQLANTDPLTGLANRARFFDVATEELRQAAQYQRPLALCMVDIDFFKRVNDTYGHDCGDAALRAFADSCRTWTRRRDVVARLGGEEFGVLLPDTDAPGAYVLAERLRAAIAALRVEGLLEPMTISVGVTQALPGEQLLDGALGRADRALYAAKRGGRNRTVLYEEREERPCPPGTRPEPSRPH